LITLQQGARWARGGARIDVVRPRDLSPQAIEEEVEKFYWGGGEYLIYDSTVFGDYPVYVLAGSNKVLVALGRDVNAIARGCCATSFIWDYRGAFCYIIDSVLNGSPLSQGVVFDLESGLIVDTGFADYKRKHMIDESHIQSLRGYRDQILFGEIVLERPDQECAAIETEESESGVENLE